MMANATGRETTAKKFKFSTKIYREAMPMMTAALERMVQGIGPRQAVGILANEALLTCVLVCPGKHFPNPGQRHASSGDVELKLRLRAPITTISLALLRASIMSTTQALSFTDAQLHSELDRSSDEELDALDFGVIGFDAGGSVRRYNSFESKAAGLSPARVLGQPLFTVVAPCMNNFMVGQRFEDALANSTPLDDIVDYVLTLRMRPVKVKLRLLATPGADSRYVLVQRST